MQRVAFLTGGTGLLGSWLIRSLVTSGYQRIYVLARGSTRPSAESRVFKTLRTYTNGLIIREAHKKVKVIRGDLHDLKLALKLQSNKSFLASTTDVFHTAALTEFRTPLEAIRIPNVIGTRNVFELALMASREGNSSIRVHHISTIAVAGTLRGQFGEEQFDCGQNFHNPYEQSKFEAEQLAREYRNKGLCVNIYRPSIITGDSENGITTSFKMIYQPLHMLALELFRELPADGRCLHSLVPVDKVAQAICLLSESTRTSRNHTWHLLNPHEIRLSKFVDTASQVFHCHRPALIPLESFSRKRLSIMQWNLISPFVPYFNYRLRSSADHTNDMLRSFGFQWPRVDDQILTRLFQYCLHSGFVPLRQL